MPSRAPSASVPTLVLGTPVLVRPGNRVHIGTDPRNGIVLELDPTVSSTRVAELLRTLLQPRSRAAVVAELDSTGLTPDDLDAILDRLVTEGKAIAPSSRRSRQPLLRIRIHGRGPLCTLLAASLTDAGFPVARTVRRPITPGAAVDGFNNLVVLGDQVVHEQWLVSRLMAAGVAHLQVRVRDGVGAVGPLVLPGLSSCLDCADLRRTDLDPAWPLLAAQLARTNGHASPAITRATAALAHEQIEQLAAALRNSSPATPHLANRVLQLHPAPARIEATVWQPHPLCGCCYRDGRPRVAEPSASDVPLSWGGEGTL